MLESAAQIKGIAANIFAGVDRFEENSSDSRICPGLGNVL